MILAVWYCLSLCGHIERNAGIDSCKTMYLVLIYLGRDEEGKRHCAENFKFPY